MKIPPHDLEERQWRESPPTIQEHLSQAFYQVQDARAKLKLSAERPTRVDNYYCALTDIMRQINKAAEKMPK